MSFLFFWDMCNAHDLYSLAFDCLDTKAMFFWYFRFNASNSSSTSRMVIKNVAPIQHLYSTPQCNRLDHVDTFWIILIHLNEFSSWYDLASIFLATAAAVRSFCCSFDFSSSDWHRSSSWACWESMAAFSSTRCFHRSSSCPLQQAHCFKANPYRKLANSCRLYVSTAACTYTTQMATPNSGLLLLCQACCSLLCFCFPTIHSILALNDLLRWI